MKVGLFFGSFNPIHIGHLAIANYMLEYSDMDKIWFVVSPQNPFKEKKSLLAEHHRLRLVDIAIEDDLRFKASNIEFSMPQPSYTVDTLAYLKEKHPDTVIGLSTPGMTLGSPGMEVDNKFQPYNVLLLKSDGSSEVYSSVQSYEEQF